MSRPGCRRNMLISWMGEESDSLSSRNAVRNLAVLTSSDLIAATDATENSMWVTECETPNEVYIKINYDLGMMSLIFTFGSYFFSFTCPDTSDIFVINTIVISAKTHSFMIKGLPQSSPNRPILSHPHPSSSLELNQAIAPSCWRPTNNASSLEKLCALFFALRPHLHYLFTIFLSMPVKVSHC